MLIALAGLPGTGKTCVARDAACRFGALHLRIDSIEQALLRTGMTGESVGAKGYAVAYALAEDNLRLGRIVIADSVNPLAVTREAWRATAARAGVPVVEVEVVCSDRQEHRRRIESRVADIAGCVLPTWQDVLDRHYEAWEGERTVIDTAHLAVSACVDLLDRQLHAVAAACRRTQA
ncbi:adenylyl-sulfate kinase [Dyella mobilis]|uniref:AAA family ATPase n=2 Tax=Dyella mobilis TaxID=1849582 RepID=A0ABS2KAI1_9GAMM|nr:AAA family ATPase [Dyella mobilis]MBM7128191.1 AAA family ATPase [Dyella mobilis]GLR00009.1 adenylyl-sulfate kinase [Dyella mobilis]